MITGYGLAESRVTRNLGMGQKECPGQNMLRPGGTYGVVEETLGKAAYQFGRTLPSNDKGKR